MLYNSTLLDQTVKKHAITSVLSKLSITEGTLFNNQDYAIYCVYSTLDLSDVSIDQIHSSEDIILVRESTFSIDGLYANNILPITEEHNLLSISYSAFNIRDVKYDNSSLELMIIIFSEGNIQNIKGSNLAKLTDSDISFDYGLFMRSTTIYNFDIINFDDVSLSTPKFIVAINSDFYSLINHNISNINAVIYTLENVN